MESNSLAVTAADAAVDGHQEEELEMEEERRHLSDGAEILKSLKTNNNLHSSSSPPTNSQQHSQEDESEEEEDNNEGEKYLIRARLSPKKAEGGMTSLRFSRFWSPNDEIEILQSVLRALEGRRDLSGKSVAGVAKAAFDDLKCSTSKDFGRRQLTSKIRKLKLKFGTNYAKPVDKRYFLNPHDRLVFELSEKIWGSGGKAVSADATDAVLANGSGSGRSKKSSENLHWVSPRPVSPAAAEKRKKMRMKMNKFWGSGEKSITKTSNAGNAMNDAMLANGNGSKKSSENPVRTRVTTRPFSSVVATAEKKNQEANKGSTAGEIDRLYPLMIEMLGSIDCLEFKSKLESVDREKLVAMESKIWDFKVMQLRHNAERINLLRKTANLVEEAFRES